MVSRVLKFVERSSSFLEVPDVQPIPQTLDEKAIDIVIKFQYAFQVVCDYQASRSTTQTLEI